MNDNLLRDCLHNLRRRCSCVRLFVKRKWRSLFSRFCAFAISIKKETLLFFYKLKQKFSLIYSRIIETIEKYSPFFRFALFGVFLGALVWLVHELKPNVSGNDLSSLAFAIGGIIGASIAIIFSFSTFILQSTADLFSTQYLNKFVEDKKEKFFFWLLVSLTGLSFSVPFLFQKYVLEVLLSILLSILFFAFYLIYELYIGLRKRINPENTLTKIKRDSLKMLEKINRELKKHTHIKNMLSETKEYDNALGTAADYLVLSNWHAGVLENVKYLYEIGLRLLAKNEINAFNLTIKYIHDIYLKHLNLRDGCFISMWGVNCDEGFTTEIFEYLQSIGDRVIKEKRKENIRFLLRIYESALNRLSSIEYTGDLHNENNPLLKLACAYYIEFIEKLLASKEKDWVFDAIQSLSRVSNVTLQKTNVPHVYDQINKMINKVSMYCVTEGHEVYLTKLVNIYFDQIKVSWNKYRYAGGFWEDLFKGLKQGILSMIVSSNSSNLGSLSLGGLFIEFHAWQEKSINLVIALDDKKEQEESLFNIISLLEKWSEFLFDFARESGLSMAGIGLFIIQSVEANLIVIDKARDKFKRTWTINKIYETQIHILSCYFQNTGKMDDNLLRNLDHVLNILLQEISNNLKKQFFDVEDLINLYIRLIEQRFDKASLGLGFNRPRTIKRLVYLGVLLNKYGKAAEETKILFKMDELNNKYLELNKDSFNQTIGQLVVGPSEFQLCEEIHQLGKDLSSSDRYSLGDLEKVLIKETKKEDWDSFVKKISYCNNYDLTDLSPDLDIFKEDGFGSG